MATISITVPDNLVDDLTDALGWNADLGVSRAQYGRAHIAQYLKNVLYNYRLNQAELAAQSAATTEVNGIS